jgi:hypothetical protein
MPKGSVVSGATHSSAVLQTASKPMYAKNTKLEARKMLDVPEQHQQKNHNHKKTHKSEYINGRT